MSTEEGVDISNYNALTDAHAVHDGAGKSFAYSLVLDGASQAPSIGQAHEAHTAALQAAGIPVGPYQFCRPQHGPEESADAFVAHIGPATDLPPVADVEVPGFTQDWLKRYTARLRSHGLDRLGWYTNGSTYGQVGSPHPPQIGFDWLWYAGDRPLNGCLVWQYGQATVAGIRGQTDVDRFIGDDASWAWFTSKSRAPVAPSQQEVEDLFANDPDGAVRWAYWEFLGRHVDPGGYATFVPLLQKGGKVGQLIQALTDSDEGKTWDAHRRAHFGF